eukprot:jgi/Bigna1/90025/estExt_fgenesh1_pg.C_600088
MANRVAMDDFKMCCRTVQNQCEMTVFSFQQFPSVEDHCELTKVHRKSSKSILDGFRRFPNGGSHPIVSLFLSFFFFIPLASQSRRVGSPIDQALSQPFHVNQGLPQGAPESPVPFALFVDDLTERLRQRGCGVQFANTRRPGLFFAGDIALVAATPPDIKLALEVTTQWCREWRLKANGDESGIVIVGSSVLKQECSRCEFRCCGELMRAVNQHRHLGITFQSSLSLHTHIVDTVKVAKRASGRLKHGFAGRSGLRPRTRIHLWNALVRPTLERGMGPIHPILPQCLKNRLQSVQTQFLRETLRAHGQPLCFLLSERGQEGLQARWDKSLVSLLSRMRQQPDESMTKDLLLLSLDQADALCSSWGHNVRSVLHRVTGCDQSACGLDLLVNLDQSCPKLVDVDLNRRVRAHLSTNGNLCRSFCSFVKPDIPICRSRAWARSHIGRPASRLFECRFDDWHDNSGVLLKLQLRAGTCETEEHRAKVCNLPPSFSVCPLCNAEVVQSVNHLIHHCSHLNAERCKLLSHTRSALGSASSLHSSFFDAPDSSKTKVLLGAPSGDPIADRHVDMAFRKFLLRVEVLRRQNFAANLVDLLVTVLTETSSRHCTLHAASVLQHFGSAVFHRCFIVSFIPDESRQDEGVLLKLCALQAMSPLGRGCCGWREVGASNCNDWGFVSAKAGDASDKVPDCGHCEARCPSGLGTKSASSSIFMPSSEGNVSAKAGDVVVGTKQTVKVWSTGLFAWGSQVWCSCLVISKHEQTITAGFGDACS